MDENSNSFSMGKAMPITFQAFGGQHDGCLLMDGNLCMSASNTEGFTQTVASMGDTRHRLFRPARSNGQQYFFSTAPMESAPAQPPVTANYTEDWDFQPDPNIEGHWIAVLQLNGSLPARQQNAGMEYPVSYSEQPTEQLYQMHPQVYQSPIEPYSVPRRFSSNSSISSPYLSSSGYLTPSSCSVSTEQSSSDTPVPENHQKRKHLANSKVGSMQSGAFQCRVCREKFSKKSNRNEHERIHNSDKPRVPCTEYGCHKDFGRPADLARHRRSSHLNDRHICRYCRKTFNRSDIKRRHEANSCRKQKAELQVRMQADAHRRDTIGRRRSRF